MIMKAVFAVSLVSALGFTGAAIAHEPVAAPGQSAATQAMPCEDANGQPIACEGYQGSTGPGRQGAAGTSSMPGSAMMQGNNSTPGQGTGPAQQRGHGMN